MIELFLSQIRSLLEHDDLESSGRELLCDDPSCGACSDDHKVHLRLSFKLGLLNVHNLLEPVRLPVSGH